MDVLSRPVFKVKVGENRVATSNSKNIHPFHVRHFPHLNYTPDTRQESIDNKKTENSANPLTTEVSGIRNVVNQANGFIWLTGDTDVDRIYSAYLKNPTWFKGSSEEAFANREAIYQLTLNALGDDWVNTITTYANDNKLGYYELGLFTDVLRELGVDNKSKPRYTLEAHSRRLDVIYSDECLRNYHDERIVIYNPQLHGSLTEFGVHQDCSVRKTIDLIQCICCTKGIDYLVLLLYCLYGSRIIKSQ